MAHNEETKEAEEIEDGVVAEVEVVAAGDAVRVESVELIVRVSKSIVIITQATFNFWCLYYSSAITAEYG